MLAAAAFQYFRALPVTAATSVIPAQLRLGTAPVIPWPAQGEAALFVDGIGEVGRFGGQSPVPMASTAKMMTALLVLEDHPLALNEPGPTITVTPADVNTFFAERNQGESVLPVTAGEQLTEYQLLQGLLLPSASNYAQMVATWDLGTVPAFVARTASWTSGRSDANGCAPRDPHVPRVEESSLYSETSEQKSTPECALRTISRASAMRASS